MDYASATLSACGAPKCSRTANLTVSLARLLPHILASRRRKYQIQSCTLCILIRRVKMQVTNWHIDGLHPCPFCGSTKQHVERTKRYQNYRWFIVCESCGTKSGNVTCHKNDEIPVSDLLRHWNTRWSGEDVMPVAWSSCYFFDTQFAAEIFIGTPSSTIIDYCDEAIEQPIHRWEYQ